MIENHWKMEAEFLGAKLAGKSFRKHILWYSKGLDNPTNLENWPVN